MKKTIFLVLFTIILFYTVLSCNNNEILTVNKNISAANLITNEIISLQQAKEINLNLKIIHISGFVNYFGINTIPGNPYIGPASLPGEPIPYGTGLAGVKVWIAEYPITKFLNITSDVNGFWDFYLIKLSESDLEFSFIYKKDCFDASVESMVMGGPLSERWSFVDVKSNVYTIQDEDVEDVAIQMPDEIYLALAKTDIENSISTLIGSPYEIFNISVSTVGKSWASLYNPILPHGDSGAIVLITPLVLPFQGPIYFNEYAQSDPTYTATSVDGGVLFNNFIPGDIYITAEKSGVEYESVRFKVDDTIKLFISSPPHSIQGNNDSGPGDL